MSGSPVFIETKSEILFFGIYTGSIYPDSHLDREKIIALGTCCAMQLCWN